MGKKPSNAIVSDVGQVEDDGTGSSSQDDVDTGNNSGRSDAVIDTDYIPFIRRSDIKFLCSRLRPERQVWFFFDNRSVSHYIERPNVIETSTYDPYTVNDLNTGSPAEISIGTAAATVLLAETDYRDPNDEETAFTRLYVSSFKNVNHPISNGAPIITIGDNANTDYSSFVNTYKHYSGEVDVTVSELNGPAGNCVALSLDASVEDGFYVGNTITILTGPNAGLSAKIIDYSGSGAFRIANVEPAFDYSWTVQEPAADDPNADFITTPDQVTTYYSIGDDRVSFEANNTQSFWVSDKGFIAGILHIPDPNDNPDDFKIQTGDRIFRVIDNPRNDTKTYTTRSDYRYVSNGTQVSKEQLIYEDGEIVNASTEPNPIDPTPTPADYDPGNPVAPEPTPTPTTDPCKIDVAKCNLKVDGGCFTRDASSDATGVTFNGGYLDKTCAPRWRYVDARGNVIKGYPNRPFSDSTISTDAVQLKVPGAVNYASYGWTAGYWPNGEPLTDDIIAMNDTEFDAGTYMQYWDPDTNGWGDTLDVSGQTISKLMCKGDVCAPKRTEPTAQSFYVAATEHKDGVFLSSVELFFRNKGSLPIEVQIRPMVNGFPSSDTIIPGAVSILESRQVATSEYPTFDDPATVTKFTFQSPVYLEPAKEYCFCVITDDWGYDFYTAELGKEILGTNRVVSKQPYSGSIFKSQNGRTWTPIQAEDAMFRINICSFLPSAATVIMTEDKDKQQNRYFANTVFDSFNFISPSLIPGSTSLKYYYKAITEETSALDGSYTAFKHDMITDMTERKVVLAPDQDNSVFIRTDMSTSNPDVSPVLYKNKQQFIAHINIINDNGLSNSMITITDPGSGLNANNIVVSFRGYDLANNEVGYGANAYAIIDGGQLSAVYVDNGGVGYSDNVAVYFSGTGSLPSAVVTTETSPSGGSSWTRYISKTVTLVDGFDAGDLRAYITAVKPIGAKIDLYYKVRNALDPEPIDNRNWIHMVQKTSPYIYSQNSDQIEYEFRPSISANAISYSTSTATYKTFNQFQIKIVLSSDGTIASKLPYVYDVRAIAMPEDIY
jgi:hypothetical protein